MSELTELTAVSPASLVVAISISEPADDELVRLGLSELHVRHAFIELVRHVLARGWSVAYGGDLRKAGYTEALFDLVRTYDREDTTGPERVLAYLSWPNWQQLTPHDRAELANIATLKEIDPPPGAPDELSAADHLTAAERLWRSQALTEMRHQMTATIDARVVLGGRVSGQQGLYPGVAEEAMLAIKAGIPLYVAGGFGGCGRAVASALEGDRPEELTIDYQLTHTPHYPELLEAAKAAGYEPSYDEMVDIFFRAGVAGLQNGLDEDQNQRLFTTDEVDEIVALILRGLRRIGEA